MNVAPATGNSAPLPAGVQRSRLRRLRFVCTFIVSLSILEFLIATTSYQILRLPPSTDFATYYISGVLARRELSPYNQPLMVAQGHALGFEHSQFPYLYPPPFALAMQPFASLSYPRARQVWMLLTTLALLATLGFVAILLRAQARALHLEHPHLHWLVWTAFVPAALNSTSVHNDIRAGSVGIFLAAALAAAAWAVLARRSALAGSAVAAAALIKLVPVALVPWLLWRGPRRGAVVALLLLALATTAAVMHWGWAIFADYIQDALLLASTRELPRPMNQSIDAMLSRLLVPNSDVHAFADLPRLKFVLSLGLGLLVVVLTLRTLRTRRQVALLPVELGMVTLALLALMKITWVHTLAAMLFVWPCTMLAIARAAERGAPWAVWLGLLCCAGFFLSSAHFPLLWHGWTHGPQSLVLNLHGVGVLLLWVVTRWVLVREAEVTGAPA
ncbi:MAG TPA: glycosyltransferase family 87 protein [Candidatus Krumholzibacteria bacterium]|nr:glycosyltransferase family 87 protein [Candidatus Krumholzibacteria bacterium]